MTKKKSKKLDRTFWRPDEKTMNTVLREKLAQFNTRYENITRTILSHTERSFVDVRLALMEDRYLELFTSKEQEMNRYIHDIMKHPEVLEERVGI